MSCRIGWQIFSVRMATTNGLSWATMTNFKTIPISTSTHFSTNIFTAIQAGDWVLRTKPGGQASSPNSFSLAEKKLPRKMDNQVLATVLIFHNLILHVYERQILLLPI